MKVTRHETPPVPAPPPTFDIVGLTLEQATTLMNVCEKSTWVSKNIPGGGTFNMSLVLNDLYHALRMAGVPYVSK